MPWGNPFTGVVNKETRRIPVVLPSTRVDSRFFNTLFGAQGQKPFAEVVRAQFADEFQTHPLWGLYVIHEPDTPQAP